MSKVCDSLKQVWTHKTLQFQKIVVFLAGLSLFLLSGCDNAVAGGEQSILEPSATADTNDNDGDTNNNSDGNNNDAGGDQNADDSDIDDPGADNPGDNNSGDDSPGGDDPGSDPGGDDSSGDDPGGDTGGDTGGGGPGDDDPGGDNSGGGGPGDDDPGGDNSGGNDSSDDDPGDDDLDGPQVFIVDPDHADASDENDGVNAPFTTLQHGLSVLEPGDTLLVEASVSPYRLDNTAPEAPTNGFVLTTGGTAEAPITIIGSDTGPIIDQGKMTIAEGEPVFGILLDCVSHVVIRNFEIRNSNDAGITTSLSGCSTTDIVIENVHIHHVYGSDAVGGIRIANTSNAVIRENQIHDIFIEDGPATEVTAASDPLENVVVNNNSVSTTDAGVTLLSNTTPLTSIQVHHNQFENLDRALHLRSTAGGNGYLEEVNFFANLVTNSGSALDSDLDRSTVQSQQIKAYNNTFVALADVSLRIAGISSFENYNNIFVRPGDDLLLTVVPQAPGIINSISFSDYNLIWQGAGPAWTLELGSDSAQRFVGLNAWRQSHFLDAREELLTDPDLETVWADPVFADEAAGSYVPQSPLTIGSGRFGENIGALSDGEVIGLSD